MLHRVKVMAAAEKTGASVRDAEGELDHPKLSIYSSLLVKVRILISMIQVLSQLGVVYSIRFPPLYANLLRWMGCSSSTSCKSCRLTACST